MFAEFETYIKAHTRLSDEDIQLIRSMAIEKKVRRRQFLLREGEVCRHKMFVCSGLFRTYRTREDGSEHIMWFSPERWWTTDPESLNTGMPSRYNIEALEDSEVIMWTKNDFNYLYDSVQGLKTYTEKLISQNLRSSRERLFSVISASPEEQYDEFIETYPGLAARVPLHMVASYLGLSRKTLTRIRYAQLNHK